MSKGTLLFIFLLFIFLLFIIVALLWQHLWWIIPLLVVGRRPLLVVHQTPMRGNIRQRTVRQWASPEDFARLL